MMALRFPEVHSFSVRVLFATSLRSSAELLLGSSQESVSVMYSDGILALLAKGVRLNLFHVVTTPLSFLGTLPVKFNARR